MTTQRFLILSSLIVLEENALSSLESSPMIREFTHARNEGGLNAACAWNAERFADEEFSSRRSSQWD